MGMTRNQLALVRYVAENKYTKSKKMQLFAVALRIQLRKIIMQSQNIKVCYDLVE